MNTGATFVTHVQSTKAVQPRQRALDDPQPGNAAWTVNIRVPAALRTGALWQRAGVWHRLHRVLLTELRRRGELDLARAIVDSASLRALRGGKKLDRTLPIAARPGRNSTFLPTAKGFRSSRG